MASLSAKCRSKTRFQRVAQRSTRRATLQLAKWRHWLHLQLGGGGSSWAGASGRRARANDASGARTCWSAWPQRAASGVRPRAECREAAGRGRPPLHQTSHLETLTSPRAPSSEWRPSAGCSVTVARDPHLQIEFVSHSAPLGGSRRFGAPCLPQTPEVENITSFEGSLCLCKWGMQNIENSKTQLKLSIRLELAFNRSLQAIH